MTRIGLFSDSHSFLDPSLKDLFAECDEIWHAGDFGSMQVYHEICEWKKPVRAVYGNIDGNDIRSIIPLELSWEIEQVKVYMIHIGGYPGKYSAKLKQVLQTMKPQIFICGHSHILKVIYDNNFNLLHLNPGASGREGFHKVRTALRFNVDGEKIKDLEVIELGLR